ncbi:hypothetical protein DTO169E5_4813 [Paecilomyces variotii]|nr:hypothetical protein DTO169E5_4813 [Paecilomyces variotii]
MSPPTRQFGKLSIGETMPTTQAHRGLHPQAPADSDDDNDTSDEPSTDDDEEEEELEGRSTVMSRQEKVRDIFSAFDESTLPEEFRPELVERTDVSRRPEQCVVQGDFVATMFRLAVHDNNVYTSLRKAMPAGACAAIYFDKAQQRSRKILAEFDTYCQTGQLPPKRASMEVVDVAEELRLLVDQIEANVSARRPNGITGAAEALVTLLEDISGRNVDAFEGNRWGRTPLPGEDEDDRNLYEQLIGQSDDENGFFVLDALEELPPDVLQQYQSNLMGVLRRIESERNRARVPYILKLQALLRMADPNAEPLSPSGQKRPAVGPAGGTTKRTR